MSVQPSVPDTIVTDMKRLKQVLFNLLGNAVKFTYKGTITLSVAFKRDINILECSVKDTGIGIKRMDQTKLFKFFGTVAKIKDINRGGMGLGLTISKMMVQALGGKITLHSEPDVGSEFKFTVPLGNEDKFLPLIIENDVSQSPHY